MMRKNVYLIVWLMTVILYSCYDDKGNYSYEDIDEISIAGMPDTLVTVFKNTDTLKVVPELKHTLAAGSGKYEYTWVAVAKENKTGNEFEYEIGKEKNLNYFVDLPLGKYAVYLNVLDQETEVTWRQHFDMEVIIQTTEGWLVLCDEKGEVRLDMISKYGNQELMIRNLLDDYALPNKKGPKSIVLNITGSGDKIILMTETGACYLDPESLAWEEAFDLKYDMGKIPGVFVPTAMICLDPMYGSGTYPCSVLLTTTEVYCKTSGRIIYELPRNNVAGEEKTFKVAPFIITSADGVWGYYEPPVILYDTDNRRFVQLGLAWNETSCRIPPVANEVFPMVTGKEFVYAANTRHDGNSSYVILRDDTGKLWLHGFGNLWYNSFSQLSNYYYRIDAPDIERAELFAVHMHYRYLFYVVDNMIYLYDMAYKEWRKLDILDGDGEKIDLSGEEITFIKFNWFQYGEYGKLGLDMEYRLIIGSDKGGENGGMIRIVDIPERMNGKVTLYKEYSGFAKPVDIVYRERY